MILSMTGFGAGRGQSGEEEISVELRTVNHKFCEVKPRLPHELAALEPELARQVKETVRRGAVEVFVRRSRAGESARTVKIDFALAREYVKALDALALDVGVARDLGVSHLMEIDGVVTFEERGVELDAARQALREAAAQALLALVEMRRREGEALDADLRARLVSIREWAEQIRTLAPGTVEHYRTRLEERVAELSRGIPVEPQRLAQEVALFADRVDVAEESTRLASHLDQFEALLAADEPVGRKMEFLVQELNREVNTTGSKSQSVEISRLVVAMKAELERIREQVQNVE